MLTEYQTALILVDDILQAIQKIEGSLDLAITINCPDKQAAALIKQGGNMACGLLKAEIEGFKANAIENLMRNQHGTPQA